MPEQPKKSKDQLEREFYETSLTGSGRIPVEVGSELIIENVNVEYQSFVSVDNSRFTPLGANESFVGSWEDVTNYAQIQVAVRTDQNSATGGAVVEFSHNGTDAGWIRSVATTIPAGTNGQYFALDPEAAFVRFRYTNGPVAQTVFLAETIYKFSPASGVIQPIGATITDANVASVVRSAISARIFSGPSTGAYAPLGTDGAGRLLTATQHAQGLTDAQLRAASVGVTDQHLQPLTETQLRSKYIRTGPRIAYHAGLDGGRTAYNSTTDLVSLSTTGEQPFCALVNPVGSGMDLHIHSLDQSANAVTVSRRYRNRAITITGAARVNVNRGGGTGTGAGRFYVAGTYTATGGAVGQLRHIAANTIPSDAPEGGLILRPGDNLVWTLTGTGGLGGTMTASLTPIWLERPADT